MDDSNSCMFQLSKLEFDVKPVVSFLVEIDPDKARTKIGKNYAVTPVALTYKNKQSYFEPLIPVTISFTIPGTVRAGVSVSQLDSLVDFTSKLSPLATHSTIIAIFFSKNSNQIC